MQLPRPEYPAGPTPAWWVLAIAGIVNIVFGAVAIAWPGLTLFVFVFLFGIYAIIYGLVELVNLFRAIGAGATWWTHLLLGAFSIVAGILVLVWPGLTAITMLYIIAIWAVAIGIAEIVGAFATGQFLLVVTGVISILFGFILFANPLAGAVALVLVIGVFAIVRGIMLLVQAVRMPATPAAR